MEHVALQNNWVILRGRLCHRPNYTATKKGLHKVAFRLAIPRTPRSNSGASHLPGESEPKPSAASLPTGSEADYVTVIIIGRPAYEFQQLNLDTGAAVNVEGRLRSWDTPREEAPMEEEVDARAASAGKRVPRRDYRVEVIAEKVDVLK